MSHDVYKAPASEVSTIESQLVVVRPWGIYWVCAWFFFGAGNSLDRISMKLLQLVINDETHAVIAAVIVTYGFLIPVIIGMIKLKRAFLIAGGVVFIAITILSLLSSSSVNVVGLDPALLLAIIAIVVTLSSISAWYCLRPSFLEMADSFVVQQKEIKGSE